VRWEGVFAQVAPRIICRYAKYFERLSEQHGYTCKCRLVRCSLACLKNWAQKRQWILGWFLDNLPDGHKTYRGNLHMYPGTTVEQHRLARKVFNREMSKFARVNDYKIRYQCVCDIECNTDAAGEPVNDPRSMHYDVVVWTDGQINEESLKTAMRRAWRKAGGLRMTLKSLRHLERQAWASYVVKGRYWDEKHWRYVPARNGLDWTWGSRDFWNGQTEQSVFEDWRDHTFPKTIKLTLRPMEGRHKRFTRALHEWQQKIGTERLTINVSYLPALQHLSPFARWVADFQSRYPDFVVSTPIVEKQPVHRQKPYQAEVLAALPSTAANAVGATAIADKLGLSVETVMPLLRHPQVEWLDDYRTASGVYVYNAVYRNDDWCPKFRPIQGGR
jgi:hypothetical protein